jgi:hypothetical protein
MTRAFLLGAFVLAAVPACNEYQDPPPTGTTVPSMPASQFAIEGSWDGVTSQGRPIRFDVSATTVVIDGTVSLHHDCTGGRLELKLDGYEGQVSGDSFSTTINWRYEEGTHFYTGKLTVSGRFEGDRVSHGGFVNSVTDKQADNLGVCPAASGSWEASRN